MKISVNDTKLFELNETQKKVICNDVASSLFEDDMKRRLEWVLMHKYEQCFKRLHEEWMQILAQRMEAVPTDKDKFAQLVFSQPDYKCRQKKLDEEREKEHKQKTGQL